MKGLGAIIGGGIGGLIGAAIWAAVSHFSGYEIAWIAWGIGGLVGLGVLLGTRGEGGKVHGATAAVIAVAAVVGGKWASVRLDLNEFIRDDQSAVSVIADIVVAEREEAGETVRLPTPGDDAEHARDYYPRDVWAEARRRWNEMDAAEQDLARELPALANPDIWIVWIADDVVVEYEDAGRPVAWPDGMDIEVAWREAHYPADVWADAQARWDEMAPGERESFEAERIAMIREDQAYGEQVLMSWAFRQSFSPFDLLWLGLAIYTAAKIGAGAPRSETA